ncbi:MAG: SDR family oxidoreductase [Anaerolineae bacterium]|nr:SDR family oxidoreductase [Anaerolineae bacterium]
MAGKVCLVTGANAGIGRHTALALARKGATVVMVCRSQQRGEAARSQIAAQLAAAQDSGAVALLVADMGSQRAIRQLAETFRARYDRLDVLVNNAGATYVNRIETEDGLEANFAVNHLGYFLLTNLLLDLVIESAPARIVNVASSAHWEGTINFDDLQSTQGYDRAAAYAQSKLANILFTYELARRLEGSGVTANCVHPGVVDSNFGGLPRKLRMLARRVLTPARYREMNVKTPAEGAETVIYLAASPEVAEVSGAYFVDKQAQPSSEESQDPAIARRLWETSAALTGLA